MNIYYENHISKIPRNICYKNSLWEGHIFWHGGQCGCFISFRFTYGTVHEDSELFASNGLKFLSIVKLIKANFYFQYMIL